MPEHASNASLSHLDRYSKIVQCLQFAYYIPSGSSDSGVVVGGIPEDFAFRSGTASSTSPAGQVTHKHTLFSVWHTLVLNLWTYILAATMEHADKFSTRYAQLMLK